jgi:preprotein translocase subunit SecF
MDIIGKGRILGIISTVLVIASIVLIITPGLNLGIDFKSGTTITYRIDGEVPKTDVVREAVASTGHDEAVVQSLGQGEFLIRVAELEDGESVEIAAAIERAVGSAPTALDTTTVGKSIADDTVRNSLTAILIAAIFVMLYIIWAFRSVPNSYRYAFAAVVALGHDVALTLGVFVVLGQLIGVEVNAIFIVGILTVIGYSVNDTIVIFDRLRENTLLAPNRPFKATVNLSINETITRSLATSITTATVILAMLLFGGPTLRDFLIVLLTGVVVGSYSSIFVASNLLVAWQSGTLGKVIRAPLNRLRRQPEPA